MDFFPRQYFSPRISNFVKFDDIFRSGKWICYFPGCVLTLCWHSSRIMAQGNRPTGHVNSWYIFMPHIDLSVATFWVYQESCLADTVHSMPSTVVRVDDWWPLLCTWWGKWAEQPPKKIMKQSKGWNNLQICPHRDSNMVVVICGPTRYR